MSPGEVQPLAVRSDIAGLRPLVGPTEVIDGVLDVLLLLLVRVLLDGVAKALSVLLFRRRVRELLHDGVPVRVA